MNVPVPKDGAEAAVEEAGAALPKVNAGAPDVTDVEPKVIAGVVDAAAAGALVLPKVTAGVLAFDTPKVIIAGAEGAAAAEAAGAAFGMALAVRQVSHVDTLGLFIDSQHAHFHSAPLAAGAAAGVGAGAGVADAGVGVKAAGVAAGAEPNVNTGAARDCSSFGACSANMLIYRLTITSLAK